LCGDFAGNRSDHSGLDLLLAKEAPLANSDLIETQHGLLRAENPATGQNLYEVIQPIFWPLRAARTSDPAITAHQDRVSQVAALLLEAHVQLFWEEINRQSLSQAKRLELAHWMNREYLLLVRSARQQDAQPLRSNPLSNGLWGSSQGEG
jgi:hypothetical protein